MNARLTALLGSLALGAVLLGGCSQVGAGGGDLSRARQPLLQAGQCSAGSDDATACSTSSPTPFPQP